MVGDVVVDRDCRVREVHCLALFDVRQSSTRRSPGWCMQKSWDGSDAMSNRLRGACSSAAEPVDPRSFRHNLTCCPYCMSVLATLQAFEKFV